MQQLSTASQLAASTAPHPGAGSPRPAGLPAWAVPRRALRCPSAPVHRDPERQAATDGVPAPLAFVPRERAAAPGVDPAAGADPGGAPAEIGAAEAARVVALAVAEALRGQRTVQQLGHHLDLECYRKVERRVRWEREARAMARSAPDPGVLRVLSCHVQAIGERVRECTASLASAERVRALCFRLELLRGRWRCVEIEIG